MTDVNKFAAETVSPSGGDGASISNHFDDRGQARMVDVSAKPITERVAVAEAMVAMTAEVARLVRDAAVAKGDVLSVARLAGIMAAKRTGEMIPLCHPIGLDAVEIEFAWSPASQDGQTRLRCRCRATSRGRTGVEMEAMTAASVTALTVYDMLKGQQRDIRIESVQLLEKSGGRSGHWIRDEQGDSVKGDAMSASRDGSSPPG